MTSNAELFRFLQKLVNDMYEDLELPGFPDVVVRLQQTLADEKSNARDIVRLVSSDPALSAKLLQQALADNLTKFETVFGEIKLPPGKSLADDLFRALQPPEPPKPEGQA